jgi:hypothetical protein
MNARPRASADPDPLEDPHCFMGRSHVSTCLQGSWIQVYGLDQMDSYMRQYIDALYWCVAVFWRQGNGGVWGVGTARGSPCGSSPRSKPHTPSSPRGSCAGALSRARQVDHDDDDDRVRRPHARARGRALIRR